MSAVIIVGAGGHGRVVADALHCAGIPVLGFTDPDATLHGTLVEGFPVLGDDSVLERYPQRACELALGIGSVGVTDARARIAESLQAAGWRLATVVHPSAIVARSAVLETGAQVMAGAIVQSGARVGLGALINTGAQVDHDCVIGAYSHVAPGAVLSGGVTLGERCHIGSGAVIIQGVRLGRSVLVGAGAVVVVDGTDGTRLFGVPARGAA